MTFLLQTKFDNNKRSVLDVGSFDVNGTYKQFFPESLFTYTGLDMEAGPNVDVVPANTYSWTELADESFDVVISGQAFEHAEFFWVTMTEIARVLKKGGFICIIAPRDFYRHRHPVDCYRFDTDGMIALAKYANLDVIHASCDLAPPDAPSEWYDPICKDSMLVAMKPIMWDGILNPKEYTFRNNDIVELATGFITQEEKIIALEEKLRKMSGL